MSKDPYAVLGVSKSASPDEIHKAYRKLAKKLHPDLNPGNAKSADEFKDVASAHDLLGDPEKRARFDRGEIDAAGAERPQQRYYREYADAGGARRYHSTAGYEDFGDASDLFADLFGRSRGGARSARMRGQDVQYRLELDFLEAVRGAKRRITLPDGSALDLTIPEGTADGHVLRLKGKGGPGIGGGPAGDALIELIVKPHPLFSRQGDDIVIELPITLDEAVLGGKIEVPTVSGRVALTIPKGSSSGQTLRLRGKGVKTRDGKHGDQLVRLKVVMPPQIDSELQEFMQKWREGHRYDPRADLRTS
ncbi:MAG TPA: DnaJ C-terminal domain-containing protein [Aestuariivirgaceae bacterium]|nr:DnaJ C-terminal domain-containing protein [Aestuariivirgaceae bacterium]